MKHIFLAASVLLLAGPASAQVTIIGQGHAQSCFHHAKMNNPGTKKALETCNEALETTKYRRDVAATHVNRGVLLMRKGETDRAIEDYMVAIDMYPKMAEAHINHGVALFLDGQYDAAVTAYDKAIALNAENMADVLFNRALAYERLGDARAAYYDLQAVLEIKPDWDLAQNAISRFTVTRSNS